MTKPTIAEKNAAVLEVLRKTGAEPLGPSEIARRVAQPWCCDGGLGNSAPVVPVLRRIGAVRHRGGRYTSPEAAS